MKRFLFVLCWSLVGVLQVQAQPVTQPATASRTREVYPLNDDWLFSFRHENSSDNARSVTLPHTWNLDALAGNPAYLRTTADYLRKLYVPQAWAGKRLFVKCHGAQTVATLWINGKYVGEHRGGTTAFTFEITDFVRFGAENQLRMAVNNAPVGDVLPLSAIHNIYGGLYRGVELIVTDPTAISPIYLGSEGVLIHPQTVTSDQVEAEAEIHVISRGENACRLTLEVFDPAGEQVVAKTARFKIEQRPITVSFSLENPLLWSLDEPNLYRVRVSLESDTSHDQVTVTTGFRSLRVTPGEGFLLNDSPVKVHGVALPYDRAGIGNALTRRDYDEDFAFVRELGANALRSPVGPHAQCLYDLCNREGVLVWIDLPLIRSSFLSDISYYPNPRLEENGRQQLREIIAQNQNHPSVAMWGLFDRLWQRGENPAAYVRSLNELAHRLDPSRPTVACSDQDGELNLVTDLIVWAQNTGWERGRTEDLAIWLEHLQAGWRHLLSGIAYGVPAASQSARAQARFHEDYTKYLAQDSLLWGVWINSLFDFGAARLPQGIERTGLVTMDRRECRDAFYLYKALWRTDEATLHIADRHDPRRSADLQTVTVYSSAGEPTVTMGRDTLPVKEYAPCIYRCDSVQIKGMVSIEATAGERKDRVIFSGENALITPPRRALRQTAGLLPTN